MKHLAPISMKQITLTTQNGYDLGEVLSAFQKMIRFGHELEALYWADECCSKFSTAP